MLSKMKVAELREIAEANGVDHSEAKNKQELLALMAEEGVDDAFYASTVEAVEDDPMPAPAPAKPKTPADTLVFMNRANPTFEIKGHRFTSQHPYVAMSSDEAQEVFDFDPRGFRLATPNEVKEYYS
jgi:hypothetical protein